MKEAYKLRKWVKVAITLIILGIIIYFYNMVMHTSINLNYKILYWLFVILSFAGLTLLWDYDEE